MTDETTTTVPSLEDWQHWGLVMARANQMIMEAWAENLAKGKEMPGFGLPVPHQTNDPMAWMTAGADGARSAGRSEDAVRQVPTALTRDGQQSGTLGRRRPCGTC